VFHVVHWYCSGYVYLCVGKFDKLGAATVKGHLGRLAEAAGADHRLAMGAKWG
jgi:hypothetical protein